MNTHQHDELASLFANLSTQPQQAQHAAAVQQPQYEGQAQSIVESLQPMNPEKIDTPITFASAHYTGTTHVRLDTQSEPSRSPPPPYHEALMPEAMADSLRQHSIDPFALLPHQIDLFANADYEQRLRLLELWRIAPPSYPLEQHLGGQWGVTSVQKEEEEARSRYEQQMQARHMPQQEQPMMDPYMSESFSPIRHAGETAWPPAARMRAASIAAGEGLASKIEVEPYIALGYSQHSDPVYAATGQLWGGPPSPHAQRTGMEDQYGMYEQIRNHADWERMNEQTARERMAGYGGDEDMVM